MDLGVVFPIANGAQIMSKASPHPTPTFALQRTIAQTAERYGFEYGLAQVTLKGFGGATGHWDESQDSLSLVAGLGLVTERMRLIGSVALPTLHPAMVARMAVTTGDICGGRLDLNLVTGWNKAQYAQMGLWPGDHYYGQRYDYAEEYVTILRELWEHGRSDFKGRFYELDDCHLGPTPAEPVGLVCAGQSERGLRFVAAHGDYCYILGTGGGVEGIAAVSAKVQALADEAERELTSHTVVICILAETDDEARAKERRYVEEADVEAIATMQRQAGLDVGGGTSARIVDVANATFQNIERVVGGPATVAKWFDELAEVEGLAGCFIIFDEPVDGVELFGREVLPRMRSRTAVGT